MHEIKTYIEEVHFDFIGNCYYLKFLNAVEGEGDDDLGMPPIKFILEI